MNFTGIFFFALLACLYWALPEPVEVRQPRSFTVEIGDVVEFDVEKGSKLIGFSLCRSEEEKRYGMIEIASDAGVRGFAFDCHDPFEKLKNFEFEVSGHVTAKVHNAGKMYFVVHSPL